jgi:hypothetical protein
LHKKVVENTTKNLHAHEFHVKNAHTVRWLSCLLFVFNDHSL